MILLLPYIVGFILSLTMHAGFYYELPYFLFGITLQLDSFTHPFLLFSTFIWLIAAIASLFTIHSNKQRYWILFFMTYFGNFALIIAGDAISFYLFFSLMSFSAFGLILHNQSKEAKEAAFSYIKFAVFGEVLLFLAVVYLMHLNGSVAFSDLSQKLPPLLVLLILAGFGVKVGLFLLHPWLPKAHAQAPGAVSALLSGVMLKTGVLGWMQFLSLGSHSYELIGYILAIFGFMGVFGGLYGVFQKQLKQVLAYSSISQMGYLVIIVAMVLIEKNLYKGAVAAMLIFILHHGFVKAALFLLASSMQKEGVNGFNFALATLGALLLIGIPFSSGAIAKTALKEYLLFAHLLFTLSSFVTASLMMRFLFLASTMARHSSKAIPLIALPLLLCALSVSFIYDHIYSFDLMQLLPLIVTFALFYLLHKKQKQIPLLPTADIANFVPKLSFKRLQKPIHEQKIYFSRLEAALKKAETFLQTQRYSLSILLVLILLFYLFSSL
ncbi:MAG: complex I subunit 5 family protein [Campylobacterota bacterium]